MAEVGRGLVVLKGKWSVWWSVCEEFHSGPLPSRAQLISGTLTATVWSGWLAYVVSLLDVQACSSLTHGVGKSACA